MSEPVEHDPWCSIPHEEFDDQTLQLVAVIDPDNGARALLLGQPDLEVDDDDRVRAVMLSEPQALALIEMLERWLRLGQRAMMEELFRKYELAMAESQKPPRKDMN